MVSPLSWPAENTPQIKMIQQIINTGNKSNRFANDQIIHHISVSSQSQLPTSIGFQNFHLNHGLTTQLASSNPLLSLGLATRSTNQVNCQSQYKQPNKIRNNDMEKESKPMVEEMSKTSIDEEAAINKMLPKELLLKIFSFLDVVSLCRSAQVCKYWNILAKDGMNWKSIDLFNYQTDISSEVVENLAINCKGFLKQLSLKGCKNISDTALMIFAETCQNIELLNLNDCRKLTDVAIEKLGINCKKLINLNLALCNEITNSALIAIAMGCPNLKYLDISCCYKITVDGIRSIAQNCNELVSFKARMCKLDNDSLIAIADNCKNLETLSVQNWIKLSDISVHKLGLQCKELKYLCLSGCKELTDYALISIGRNCTNLEALEVTNCINLSDNSFRVLTANCNKLTSLDLEECIRITDNTLLFLSTGCPLLANLVLSLCEQVPYSLPAAARHPPRSVAAV